MFLPDKWIVHCGFERYPSVTHTVEIHNVHFNYLVGTCDVPSQQQVTYGTWCETCKRLFSVPDYHTHVHWTHRNEPITFYDYGKDVVIILNFVMVFKLTLPIIRWLRTSRSIKFPFFVDWTGVSSNKVGWCHPVESISFDVVGTVKELQEIFFS